MCYVHYINNVILFIFLLADSALNRVKQRLQFLRPPLPKTDSPAHEQHQSSSSSSSSSSDIPVIIDLTTTPEFPFEAVTNNDNEAPISGVDRNVSDNKQFICLYKFVPIDNYNKHFVLSRW